MTSHCQAIPREREMAVNNSKETNGSLPPPHSNLIQLVLFLDRPCSLGVPLFLVIIIIIVLRSEKT